MKVNKLCQIKDPEGIVHYDDIGKANLLNEYFTSVFTVDTVFEEYATLDNNNNNNNHHLYSHKQLHVHGTYKALCTKLQLH